MDSTVMRRSTEADDALAARADERLAHAYEQIARADEQLARLTEELTKMEQDAAHHPSAIPLRRPPRGRPALRGLIGLMVAACIIGAALVSQSSYGEAAKPIIAQWAAPYMSSASWLALAKPALPAQPGPSSVQAAEAAPPQATPAAQPGPEDIASRTAASTYPELAQLLQTMARDLATVQQGIEQLKASQQQMASDNAKAVEQVRASQEQMTRLVAKVSEKPSEKTSEQDPRARALAPPPRTVAGPTRKPVPSQARAQPMQLQPTAR